MRFLAVVALCGAGAGIPLSALLASCGGDEPEAGAPAPAPSDGSVKDVSADVEAAASPPGAPRGLADESVVKGGYLAITEYLVDGGSMLNGSGEFFDGTGTDVKCTEVAMNECRVLSCTNLLPQGPTPLLASGKLLSAGGIDVTSLSGATANLGFHDAGDFYVTKTATIGTGDGGLANLTADGGVVPAFTSSAQLPPPLTLTVPNPTQLEFTQKYGEQLTIAFDAKGHPGDVEVLLGQSQTASTQHVRIRCLVPASAGTYAVPVDVMTKLDSRSSFQFRIASIFEKEQAAGDYRVLVRGESGSPPLRGSFTN